MRESARTWTHRIRAALVVAAITLGILTLVFLQFFVPYALGPAGLAGIVALDLATYLGLRHRRTRRLRRAKPRKTSLIVWGPVDRRYVSHVKHPLEAELLASFLFVAFLIGIYVVGEVIRIESWSIDPNADLFLIGGVMTTFVGQVLQSMCIAGAGLASESEKFDTTADH